MDSETVRHAGFRRRLPARADHWQGRSDSDSEGILKAAAGAAAAEPAFKQRRAPGARGRPGQTVTVTVTRTAVTVTAGLAQA